MKKLLNTLYVTTQGAYLHKEGLSIVVEIEKEVRLRVPIHNLQAVVCFGNVMCSPYLMGHCAENGVSLSFLTAYGRFLGSVQGPVSGNVLLRREQYRMADRPETCLSIAKTCLQAKVVNARTVLLRGRRDGYGESGELESLTERLKHLLRAFSQALTLDELRGLEGDAAKSYFSGFNHLLTQQKESFVFTTRSRRPPTDRINALLSFLYTLLAHDITSALESNGLDPCVGFLHTDRPGRKSLALDIMEEFRPWFADRLALSMINRQQIQPGDFRNEESGAVLLNDDGRKKVLDAWQKRKQEELRHPFIEETIPLGLFPHVQALLLARYIRGDLDAYPPVFWK